MYRYHLLSSKELYKYTKFAIELDFLYLFLSLRCLLPLEEIFKLNFVSN